MRKPVTQKRKKARGGRTSDAKDDINHNQTVPWTCDTIVEGLKEGETVEPGEDEQEAWAEDKNISQLDRDHGGC